MKTYVLMISKRFPAYHPKAGEDTGFRDAILNQYHRAPDFVISRKSDGSVTCNVGPQKCHTIRANYDLWAHRAAEINAGRAILSLRQWTGSPYNYARDGSKQEEFLQLKKIHVQKVRVIITKMEDHTTIHTVVEGRMVGIDIVAKNDGLAVDDFCKWFNKGLNEGACIQFTDFKY
jgi:hypothetical protein